MATIHVFNLKSSDLRAELRLLEAFTPMIHGVGLSKEQRRTSHKIRITNAQRGYEIRQELKRRGE